MARYKTERREFWVAHGRERTYTMKSLRESRFAQLLECLVRSDDVVEWWYEPKTFKCKRMYRRERLYTPDFLIYTGTDVFDTGCEKVWVEVKATLSQNDNVRLHCLAGTYPIMRDIMLLVVDKSYAGKRSKTAQRQRVLLRGARKHIHHIIYAEEWYPKFGIK
jgi:hypothetical protein